MDAIPKSFLSHASSILADTSSGLSGSKIVEFCNAWAADHGIDTPHAIYPFNAPNKRTALLENLLVFPPEIQYQMLLDLCDLSGHPRRPQIEDLRNKLLSRFKALAARQTGAEQGVLKDPYILEFLGVSGANAYENRTASPANRGLVVFLCHASEDKARARHLHRRLKADGYSPWLDEEELLPGQEWQVEIPRAVRRADVVLVCLSNGSVAKTGYVQKEIKIALDAADEQVEGAIYIIPARFEQCVVPERLSKWQWVDTFAPDGYERLCRALNAVRKRQS